MKSLVSNNLTFIIILVIFMAGMGLCQKDFIQNQNQNQKPNLLMVHRCFKALKRGNLELKPKYLCHALIKTFLLEQKSEHGLTDENQVLKVTSGNKAEVRVIQPKTILTDFATGITLLEPA